MDNSKLETTPFPADVVEMVLNKETRHPTLQGGPVFVSATITDNGPEMQYRLAFVGPAAVNGRKYENFCVDIYCDSLAEIADKLRNGFITTGLLREAGATRDKIDADRATLEAANKARKGAANE